MTLPYLWVEEFMRSVDLGELLRSYCRSRTPLTGSVNIIAGVG